MRTVTKREMLLAVGIASVILMFWGIFGTGNKNRISAQKEQKNVIENEKSLSSAGKTAPGSFSGGNERCKKSLSRIRVR